MKTCALTAFVSFTTAAGLLFTGCAGSECCPNETRSAAAADNSRFALFGTNKVHYVVEGQGTHTIVFVHCWAGNLSFWREQVPALAGRARLVLLDLPGHGQSDKPQTDYSMDFLAGAVLAVMRDAHADRATLVGHSMGVPVICRVYAQAPEKVAALVAVDGPLRRPTMTAEQADQFIGPLRTPEYRANTARFVASMFPVPGTEALRDCVLSDLLATPQYVMLSAMESLFSPDRPVWDLNRVTVPVLVINAQNPMWTPDYEAYARALSAQTDYRVIEGAGHWLMLEKPAEFNAVLTDMLTKYDLMGK
jgi:pimeloyl-ACP methyl ester carboxylesterase